jgi:hypothetical protein
MVWANENWSLMTTRERRKHVRIKRRFVTEISDAKGQYETEGVTEDVSQGGAFIRTKDWRAFQTGDQAVVTFFLPSSFTDSNQSICLRGDAVIKRIDQKIEGIALEFRKNFQQFERIQRPELADKIKYKKISYYLSVIANLDFAEFARVNPYGFLVEKYQLVPDPNAAFQFNTTSLSDEYTLQQLRKGGPDSNVLEARVIDVRKRKLDSAVNTITIGRALANDIVLYNSMVSKSHAYLYVHPSGTACYLVDCGSKNGTLINGKVVRPYEKHQVTDGDEVCFGPQTRIVYFSPRSFANFLNKLRVAQPA